MGRSSPKAKKSLGQHFLKEESIARNIAALVPDEPDALVLEVGPGPGALTKWLLPRFEGRFVAVELDQRMPATLGRTFGTTDWLRQSDFLRDDLAAYGQPLHIVGNFPYNISSPILFKAVEHCDLVRSVTGMFQREIGRRICAPPGGKEYVRLTVALAAYFDPTYAFEISPEHFVPPPKVWSCVVQLLRRAHPGAEAAQPELSEVIRIAFSQRRKMLRNTVPISWEGQLAHYANQRPEQLTLDAFVELALALREVRTSL